MTINPELKSDVESGAKADGKSGVESGAKADEKSGVELGAKADKKSGKKPGVKPSLKENMKAGIKAEAKAEAGFINNAPDGQKTGRFMKGNKVQITITIDEALLEETDSLAKQYGISRAALISISLRQAIEKKAKSGIVD